MQEEIHIDESEDEPVMETVLQKVEDWHGIIWETMNEQSFKFTLQIMSKDHSKPDLLIKSQRFLCIIYLFSECKEDATYDNRSCILKQEYLICDWAENEFTVYQEI